MLPTITLIGNATHDTELRFSPSGMAIAKLRTASNDRKKNEQGEWVDGTTTFMTCTIFGKKAEAAAEITKGTRVMVTGKLAQRFWEDAQTGAKRSDFEVLVDEVAVVVKPGEARPAGQDPWGSGTTTGGGAGWGDSQANEPPF